MSCYKEILAHLPANQKRVFLITGGKKGFYVPKYHPLLVLSLSSVSPSLYLSLNLTLPLSFFPLSLSLTLFSLSFFSLSLSSLSLLFSFPLHLCLPALFNASFSPQPKTTSLFLSFTCPLYALHWSAEALSLSPSCLNAVMRLLCVAQHPQARSGLCTNLL